MHKAAEIEAQAAAWIARSDRRRAADDPELRAWLAADPRHRAAYLRLAEAWRRSERLERLRPADGSIDPDLLAPARATILGGGPRVERLRSPGPPPRIHRQLSAVFRSPAGRIAAVAALAAVVGAIWWTSLPPSSSTYRTGTEGLERIALTDGSSVIMNADTELQVSLSSTTRALVLKRGEAQFIVAPDALRPFEVHAGDHVVRALGTAFDVRREARTLQITVTQGRVAVIASRPVSGQPDGGPLPTLSAGDVALIGPSKVSVSTFAPTDLSRRLSWAHRELVFNGDALRKAVAEFNHYNDHKIVIEDPSLDSLQVGGNFQAVDSASFVSALERSFAISARTASDGTIYLSRAAAR